MGMRQAPTAKPTNAHGRYADSGPYFSIIVPFWNREETIARCVISVLQQGFSDWELLLVDDGSTDESLRRIAQYTDRRITVLRHSVNRGKCPARRTGFDHATGRWQLQVDSDDELLPDALERMNLLAQSVGEDVGVIGLTCRYDTGGGTPSPPYPKGELGLEEWLAWLDGARAVDFLICRRREVLDEVPVPNDGRGSAQAMLRTVARWRIRVDADPGLLVHSDAKNRLCEKKAELLSPDDLRAHARMMQEILEEFGDALLRRAPSYYFNVVTSAGEWSMLGGQRRSGVRRLLQALRMRPLVLNTWGFLLLGLLGPRVLLCATGVRRNLRQRYRDVARGRRRARADAP